MTDCQGIFSEIVSWAAPAAIGLLGAWVGARVTRAQAKLSEMTWIEERIRELNAGRENGYGLISELQKFGENWLVHDDAFVADAVRRIQEGSERLRHIDEFRRALAILIQDTHWADDSEKSAILCSNSFNQQFRRFFNVTGYFSPTGHEHTILLRNGRPGNATIHEYRLDDDSSEIRETLELIAIIQRSSRLRNIIYDCLRRIDEHEISLNEMYNRRAVSVFGYLPRQNWWRKSLSEKLRSIWIRG